jgi:hypothetical protein
MGKKIVAMINEYTTKMDQLQSSNNELIVKSAEEVNQMTKLSIQRDRLISDLNSLRNRNSEPRATETAELNFDSEGMSDDSNSNVDGDSGEDFDGNLGDDASDVSDSFPLVPEDSQPNWTVNFKNPNP